MSYKFSISAQEETIPCWQPTHPQPNHHEHRESKGRLHLCCCWDLMSVSQTQEHSPESLRKLSVHLKSYVPYLKPVNLLKQGYNGLL